MNHIKKWPLLVALSASTPVWAQETVPAPATSLNDTPEGAISAPTDSDAAPFDWQIQLKAGQQFRTTIEMDVKMSQNVPKTSSNPASRLETTSNTRMVVDQNVLSSDEKGARIELAYREIKHKVRVSQNGKLQFDSSQPSQGKSPLPDFTKNIVGTRISYSLSPKGKVSDLQGLKEYFGRIFASMGQGQTAAEQKFMRATMEKFMSPAAIQGAMEKSFGALPTRPVRIGESWNTSLSLPLSVAFAPSMTGTRTLLSRQDGIATIGEKSNFRSDGDKPIALPTPPSSRPVPKAKVKIAMTGSASGQTTVNETTGMARQSQLSQRIGGHILVLHYDGKGATLTSALYALILTHSTTEERKITR